MSILTDTLPDKVDICGEMYAVKTDFRTWLRFDELVTESVTDESNILEIIQTCLILDEKKLIGTWIDVIAALFKFYAGGPAAGKGKAKESSSGKRRVYSFTHDAELIYAAFLGQYGIDLQTADLHWWQFLALFRGLCGDHRICEIMNIRATDLSEIKDKKQKAHYAKLQQMYKLPDNRTDEEKESEFAEHLARII
jgi:hypothetical protein